MFEKIITYLNDKYNPHTIMIYGSFADGTNNEYSDFDAFLISDNIVEQHDGNIVDNIELDVFVYPTNTIENLSDIYRFLQLHDAKIIKDERNIGYSLKEKVVEYVKDSSVRSREQKEHLYRWCKKMLNRVHRNDGEGYYRWHWLITDSLEIYCIFRDRFYFGPKKTILEIKKNDKIGHELFVLAIEKMEFRHLERWINYIIDVYKID